MSNYACRLCHRRPTETKIGHLAKSEYLSMNRNTSLQCLVVYGLNTGQVPYACTWICACFSLALGLSMCSIWNRMGAVFALISSHDTSTSFCTPFIISITLCTLFLLSCLTNLLFKIFLQIILRNIPCTLFLVSHFNNFVYSFIHPTRSVSFH